jgi:DNA-binding response OmpR family regulator
MTDDAVEESHTTHILSKYHFTNHLVRIRSLREASKFFMSFNSSEAGDPDGIPELIILSMGGSAGSNRILAVESRIGSLKEIPLIIVANHREEEDSIRKLNLPNVSCFTKPTGFFKLLESMQKLGMRWIVLRPG